MTEGSGKGNAKRDRIAEGGGSGSRKGNGKEEKRVHYRGGLDVSDLVAIARELRKRQTPAETIMWVLLRNRRFMNLKYRRQHQIGRYVVDFYCHECKLVIELDGGVHDLPEQLQKDRLRDAYLRSLGMTVMRIRNSDLYLDPGAVLHKIASLRHSPFGSPAITDGHTKLPNNPRKK